MAQVREGSTLKTPALDTRSMGWTVQIKEHILAAVHHFVAHHAYDWDRKGGLPLREDVIRMVRFPMMHRSTISYRHLPMPTVEQTANGCLRIEFPRPDLGRTVTLLILCHGYATYKKWDGFDVIQQGVLRFPTDGSYSADPSWADGINEVLDYVRA